MEEGGKTVCHSVFSLLFSQIQPFILDPSSPEEEDELEELLREADQSTEEEDDQDPHHPRDEDLEEDSDLEEDDDPSEEEEDDDASGFVDIDGDEEELESEDTSSSNDVPSGKISERKLPKNDGTSSSAFSNCFDHVVGRNAMVSFRFRSARAGAEAPIPPKHSG